MTSGFGQAGLTTVLLPSGFRVRGVVPGLAILAERGLLDGRVQAAAVRLADPKWLKDAPADEKERDLRIYVDAQVAGFAREAQDPGDSEWKSTSLTTADLGTLDQRDRDLLEDLVMHRRTAAEVTALGESALSLLVEEAPGELDRLATFRDDVGGAAGGEDGTGVGSPSVGAARDGG